MKISRKTRGFCQAALPNSTSWSSVMMRMMLGRMFLRSLWMRPLRPWALVVVKAQLPGAQSSDRRANQDSQWISMVTETTGQRMGRWRRLMERRGGREPAGPLTHTCAALAAVMDCGETRGRNVWRHYNNKHGGRWNFRVSFAVVEEKTALHLQKARIPVGTFKHIYFR